MAGTLKLFFMLSTLISLSTALTDIENLILYSDLIPLICASVVPCNNDLLQFLCAVSGIRNGNFPGRPPVTSYFPPEYAFFPAPPLPFYSSNKPAPPVITKTYGPSYQNGPVTYTNTIDATPVSYSALPYSFYPQVTPITTVTTPVTYLPQETQIPTISAPGTVTYNSPTLRSYTSQGEVFTRLGN